MCRDSIEVKLANKQGKTTARTRFDELVQMRRRRLLIRLGDVEGESRRRLVVGEEGVADLLKFCGGFADVRLGEVSHEVDLRHTWKHAPWRSSSKHGLKTRSFIKKIK